MVTGLFIAYAVLNTYFVLTPVLGTAPAAAMMLVPVLMGGFSLAHAMYTLGIRNAAVFFILSTVISFAFESVGVATGTIFGPYHYADKLGPQLLNVPVLVPIAWFMVIYPSYAMANYIITGDTRYRPETGLARQVGLALLSAILMTAWDLVLDPQMVGEGYWTWHTESAYFGIPVQNFVGWLITTCTVYLAYRLVETRWAPASWGPCPTLFGQLPLILYGMLAIGYVVGYGLKDMPALALIAFFTMVAPCLVALIRPGEHGVSEHK
ncbi:MAG: carotenoid biosynthesis protein [Anaerolineae bacterium]|nr:carotenoid biosynthesis protein [Anaerolineae bacterium]